MFAIFSLLSILSSLVVKLFQQFCVICLRKIFALFPGTPSLPNAVLMRINMAPFCCCETVVMEAVVDDVDTPLQATVTCYCAGYTKTV